MKTRKLRIKRKVVVKSRKKGKLNRKISIRRKHRKSMMRRRTRQNKYRRHNFKKKFSRKMRGGIVIEKRQDFYKSGLLGPKNASFTVSYDDASETMTITWNSKNHPNGFTINFKEQAIIVNGNTVYAVRKNDNGDSQKIVQLYSNEIANEFKTFLDSFPKKNKDGTTGEVNITADVLITAIDRILNDMPQYEQYKTNARSDETRRLIIKTAISLPLYQNLNATQNETIKTEIINELSNYLGNAHRLVSTLSTFWRQKAREMSLADLLYYKWENDIYARSLPMPFK